jgi:predicted O-methyltransferase YrrM
MNKLVVPDGLVERHTAMRSWFLAAMALRRNEPEIIDHALTPEGAAWLVAYILHYKPRRVVELGSGFSTLALGYACASSGSRFTTADHDAGWLADVKAVVALSVETDRAAENPPCRVDKWTTLATLRSREGIRGTVDLVLVDHGPTMQTRLDDLRWIAGMLRKGGLVALDDCRTRHSYDKKVAAVLRPLGLSFGLAQDSYGRERWLGVARRRP